MVGRLKWLLVVQQKFYCFLFHNPELQDDLYVKSYVIPQATLGIIRAVIFIYCLAVLITNLVVNIVHGAGWNWAAYFTTLTFFGITMYYGVAAYTTLRYWQKQEGVTLRSRKHRLQEPIDGDENGVECIGTPSQKLFGSLAKPEAAAEDRGESIDAVAGTSTQVIDERVGLVDIEAAPEITQEPEAKSTNQEIEPQITAAPTVLHQLTLATQQVLYESFTCFAPLVTIVYWGLLYPTQSVTLDTSLDLWTGISMHVMNSVLMLVEVGVFAKSPYSKWHLWIMFAILVLYLGLAYFMVGVYDFYVYPFFVPKYFGGYIAVICLLALNIVAIVWVIMLMVHRVRDSAYSRWLLRRRKARVVQTD